MKGLRFLRSFKIAPGLRLNLSKSGIGISAGVRGLRVGVDARGRTYISAGLRGTGLSLRRYGSSRPKPAAMPQDAKVARELMNPIAVILLWLLGALLGGSLVFVFIRAVFAR